MIIIRDFSGQQQVHIYMLNVINDNQLNTFIYKKKNVNENIM